MKLDVYVHDRKVGLLEQHSPTSYVFSYLADTPQAYAVSLSMLPRPEPWESSFLFPAFQVSLPEGFLRRQLERKLSKADKSFDDMGILAATGSDLIGRVRFAQSGKPLAQDNVSKMESLDTLLSAETFAPQEQYGRSGVSGGFPKYLARSHHEPAKARAYRTQTTAEWIVKLNDSDHKNIVLLEYFGLMAAKKMGLNVPENHLSEDFSKLLIRRFDVGDDGQSLGFEDMCALMGLPAREKFNGSVEKIVKTIHIFCEKEERQKSCEQFYAQYLLSATIRNGDAHLKNFGLLYGNNINPALSPVYDMLSMGAYAPQNSWGDADDGMALTLGGTRRWPNSKAMDYLGDLCGVSENSRREWSIQLKSALLETAEKITQFVHAGQILDESLPRMVQLWAHGMKQIDFNVANHLENYVSLMCPLKESPLQIQKSAPKNRQSL